MHMNHYLEKLQTIPVQEGVADSDPYTPAGGAKCPLRAIVGSLTWMAQVRADYCYELSSLASKTAHPTWGAIREANALVEKLKARGQVELRIPKLDTEAISLVTWCDASFQNREDLRTQQGVFASLVNLRGDEATGFPWYWKSRVQIRKAVSIPGAECLALRTAAEITKFLCGFLVETGLKTNEYAATVLGDAKDVQQNVRTFKLPREANLVGDFSGLRSDYREGVLKFRHVRATGNLADFLTKKDAPLELYWRFLKSNKVSLSGVERVDFSRDG